MLTILLLVLLAGQADPEPSVSETGVVSLPGCLAANDLAERLATLAQADWSVLTRRALLAQLPEKLVLLAADKHHRGSVLYERRGQHLPSGAPICGERYEFATPTALRTRLDDGYVLRSVSAVHASRTPEGALELAKKLVQTIAPPADAGPGFHVLGEPPLVGTLLNKSYSWQSSTKRVEGLEVIVAPPPDSAERLFVVYLTWQRTPAQ